MHTIPKNRILEQYVILRTARHQVWAGTVESVDGQIVTLKDARRFIPSLAMAVKLSELSVNGLHGAERRLPMPVGRVTVWEVVEAIEPSPAARHSIEHAAIYSLGLEINPFDPANEKTFVYDQTYSAQDTYGT
jgi:hypothetical protein